MIFITNSHVKKNMSKFGFKSFDASIVDIMNQAFRKFVQKKLQRAAKIAKGAAIDHQHVSQSGGRVLMPSEYFGVSTNHYVDVSKLSSNGVDMTVNNMWIRPPMDLMGPITTGGAAQFQLPVATVKAACCQISDAKVTLAAQKTLHADFAKKMSSVLEAAQRKSKEEHLSAQVLTEAISMKKHAAFQ